MSDSWFPNPGPGPLRLIVLGGAFDGTYLHPHTGEWPMEHGVAFVLLAKLRDAPIGTRTPPLLSMLAIDAAWNDAKLEMATMGSQVYELISREVLDGVLTLTVRLVAYSAEHSTE